MIKSPVHCKRTTLRYVLPCVTPYSAKPVLAAHVENTETTPDLYLDELQFELQQMYEVSVIHLWYGEY
jgi:hypothetical protein